MSENKPGTDFTREHENKANCPIPYNKGPSKKTYLQ